MSFKHIKTKEEFISRSLMVHEGKYSYEKVAFPDRGYGKNFQGLKTRKLPEYNGDTHVLITCPKHGVFNIRPRKHLEGVGCKKCAIELRISTAAKKRETKKTVTNTTPTKKAPVQRLIDFSAANDAVKCDKEACIKIQCKASDNITREVLIDFEDKDILSLANWCINFGPSRLENRTLYAYGHSQQVGKIYGGGRAAPIHRIVMSRILGRPLEDNENVDHINHDGLDNRRRNLRLATRSQNQANRKKQRGKCSSIYKGVSLNAKNSGWHAQITKTTDGSKKHFYLGRYATEAEAARAYDKAALEMFGEYACLNFPNEDPRVHELSVLAPNKRYMMREDGTFILKPVLTEAEKKERELKKKADPEIIKARRLKDAQYREKNREKINRYHAEWAKKNRPKINEYNKRWLEKKKISDK